ncbi:hypothetical protein PoB_004061800 [Plakobranchus ocellatus]|uniref:Uncharacterized protein n=1 Tax=Plakobranchus ocellatus TaxID=259542 RepID=A0AAV4B5R3_9GAST|nr:hypothetical protein PoB_004061800 [Plakobranchus ocellatus]
MSGKRRSQSNIRHTLSTSTLQVKGEGIRQKKKNCKQDVDYSHGRRQRTRESFEDVLEVIDDGRQLFISCLRPRASSSKQAGEVWVFPNTPDESLFTPVTDTITRLSDPVVDPIQRTYTFV